SIDQLPGLVAQLAPYRRWAGSGLKQLRSDDSNPEAQLHAALALLPTDPTQTAYLEEQLLGCGIQELPVIRDMLGEHVSESKESMQGRLRGLYLEGEAEQPGRFNAALALATYEPDGLVWTATTARFVINRLLSSSVDSQSQYRLALQPARQHLVEAAAAAASD